MKLLTVVGARPQFIKAAVLSRALQAFNASRHRDRRIQEVIVHTGQHYDDNMSAVFFQELNIPEPAHHLGVGSGPHGQQTARMLERLETVTERERPDLVLVYGDTNSTLAGSLTASKLGIPVAHVEAGLRSYNRAMPEEINRVVTDHLSALLFCPTDRAVKNLSCEGIVTGVHRVGDVMYDSLLYNLARADRRAGVLAELAGPAAGTVRLGHDPSRRVDRSSRDRHGHPVNPRTTRPARRGAAPPAHAGGAGRGGGRARLRAGPPDCAGLLS